MPTQPPLIPGQRRERIVQHLRRESMLSFRQLAELLDVSHMTVRRDVLVLEEEGRVVGTSGGARIAASVPTEPPRSEKSLTDLAEKAAMSRHAASLLHESMTVYLDAGTTLQPIAEELRRFDDLTVVTNDLVIAGSLLDHPTIELIVVGGRVDKVNRSAIGRLPGLVLQELSIDIAFLTSSSWDLRRGITIPAESKVGPKQAAIAAASTVVLVAASSKFGSFARYRVAGLDALDRVITDEGLPDSAAHSIRAATGAAVDRVAVAAELRSAAVGEDDEPAAV